jgi:hypothetical protein
LDNPLGSFGVTEGIVDDMAGARVPGSGSLSRRAGRGGMSSRAAASPSARGLSPLPGTRISPSSAAAASGGTDRPVRGSVATRGRPVTGSVPEFIMASLRERRMRPRAISASLASTLPSRSMSHFRISS